jgi:predicted O-methyltransferase YrrM
MILEYVAPSRLYLIDPWEYQPEFSERKYGGKESQSSNDMQAIYESVRDTVGSHENVFIVRKRSDEAADDIEDHSLDWVYIDGNHFYEYVLADLQNYSGKVKRPGLIICDDYTWGEKHDYPVKRAVHDFLKQSREIRISSVQDDQIVLAKE